MEDVKKEDIRFSSIYTPPKIVGGYRFGKNINHTVTFSFTYKPNFIHRFFMRILLGFYWADAKKKDGN